MRNLAANWELRLALLLILGLAAVLALSFGDAAAIAMSLIWGWFFYLARVVPQVSVRWDGVLFFVVGFAVVSGCAHSFLSWLVRSSSRPGGEGAPSWRFRSTLALVALFLMVFVVGISQTGIVHQLGWLINSPEPLRISKLQSLQGNARSTYRIGVVDPRLGRSWLEPVLPYLAHMAPRTDYGLPWNDRRNASAYQTLVPEALNPSGRLPLKSPYGFGLSHFAGNSHVFENKKPVRLEHYDAEATLLIGEINTGLVPWAQPENSRDPVRGLKSHWPFGSSRELGFGSPATQFGSTVFAIMDGSVRPIDDKIDREVLRQLSELHPTDAP